MLKKECEVMIIIFIINRDMEQLSRLEQLKTNKENLEDMDLLNLNLSQTSKKLLKCSMVEKSKVILYIVF